MANALERHLRLGATSRARLRNLRDQVWFAADGRTLPLRDMATDHLENLLVWLDQRLVTHPKPIDQRIYGGWSAAVNAELARRR